MSVWIVHDLDDGELGRYRTRREAVLAHSSAPVLHRYKYGPGSYEYICGFPGEESTENFFVDRER